MEGASSFILKPATSESHLPNPVSAQARWPHHDVGERGLVCELPVNV